MIVNRQKGEKTDTVLADATDVRPGDPRKIELARCRHGKAGEGLSSLTVAEMERARAEGNNELPCDEPELEGWKDQPELREVCVAAEAALADSEADDDAVPVEL